MTSPLVYTLTNIDGFNDLLNDIPNEQQMLKINKIEYRTANNIANYKIIGYNKSLLTSDMVSTVDCVAQLLLIRIIRLSRLLLLNPLNMMNLF